MTGSHTFGGLRPVAVRVTLLAVLAVFAFGAFTLLAQQASAADTYIVNSIGDGPDLDDTDGICEVTDGGGDCTLRAAIMESNFDTDHDIIRFDPSLFTEGSPATIDISAGLPIITKELTIDAIDRGVILDGGSGTPFGFHVEPADEPFDFSVLGGGNTLTIRNVTDDAIALHPGAAVPDIYGTVVIDGVVFGPGVADSAVAMDFGADGVEDLSITNNDITAGGDAISIKPDGDPVADTVITITGNDIDAGGHGVKVELEGDLVSDIITVDVSDNGEITAGDDAVDLEYCKDGSACDATNGTINFFVNNNLMLAGGDQGVDITIDASLGASDNLDVNVSVDGNGSIVGSVDESVAVEVFICCGSSDNNTTITVDGNGDITGSPAVDIDSTSCCGDDNESHVSVSNNENILSVAGGSGIDIVSTTYASVSTVDASSNVSSVTVNGNASITGAAGDGVTIVSVTGSSVDEADANLSSATVNGNGDITGSVDGVDISASATADTNFDGDNNDAIVDVSDNGEITGNGGDGVNVFAEASGEDAALTSDNNDTVVTITGNGDIYGTVKGVEVDTVNGNGEDHDNTVTIENNADIESTVGGTGVDVDSNICCGTSNSTSTITIDGNEDLEGDAGVVVQNDVCCGGGNTGSTSVSGNGDITGDFDLGVRIFNLVVDDMGSSASDNASTVNVDDNGNIEGDLVGGGGDPAVFIISSAGSQGGAGESDINTSDVSVSRNGNVTGDGSGVLVLSVAGSDDDDGDGNTATAVVSGNGKITGFGSDGVGVFAVAIGDSDTSEDNATDISVTGNDDIFGDDFGVRAGAYVFGDPENTNDIDISGNADITAGGGGGPGILVTGEPFVGMEDFLCCSANTITITDNTGTISSGSGDGIAVLVCGDGTNGDDDCLDGSVTDLTIGGNDISDSSGDGIYICCGDFTGSRIWNNTIDANSGFGVLIDSASNLITGPDNEITDNGTGGIGIIETDLAGVSPDPEADGNTITRNSIYDNFELGIDHDADGSEGCSTDDPNNCLKAPSLNQLLGNKLVGGACGECTVEIFLADNTPDDHADRGEGRTYLISTEADLFGDFSVAMCEADAGLLTATATNDNGDTSEFALNLAFGGSEKACATATSTPLPTGTPADTATPSDTSTPSPTPTVTPTATTTVTATATGTPPTATATVDGTDTPVPPTATSTNTPVIPATPGNTIGDVNKNGVVNAIDAQLILQAEAGFITLANPKNADVNLDGEVTSVDATLIQQFVAGLIGSLPPVV